ncbi:proline/glycine betaine transporter [Klebsiella aerogenes]|nr:proline/glycine betaine transporter [Klebsiella aerogenes]
MTIIDDGKLKKAITAASLGNAMEWFDFGVYGFVAYALGKVFFPDANPSVQMIAALGTFSVPFLIRPLGGLFFGMLGDKYGRQKILAITIVIMSISTFCIGLIPSYATIGIWAPILLLLCKMAQGFSVGGEYTGASIFVAEYSPDRKRGFMGSWLDFGSIAGFVMGPAWWFSSPAWWGTELSRLGLAYPVLPGAAVRHHRSLSAHALEETPAFQQHVDTMEQGDREGLQDGPKVSFKEIATKHWRSLLTCIGLVISTNVTYYMLLTYMPSYLSHNLHYSEDHGVLIIIAIMVGMLFVQPVIGMLSDRFGRRPFILIGSVALFALAIPAFIMINSNVIGLIFAGLLLLAVVLNCFIGVMASSLPAMFPTHIRFSALASAFNISVLVAGLTPTLAAWLVETTQNLMMPAYYLMVIAVVGWRRVCR